MKPLVKAIVKQDIKGNGKSNLKLSEVKSIVKTTKIIISRAEGRPN